MNKSEAVYVLWAVMAVQGAMREADGFLQQYKKDIYQVARKLSMKFPKGITGYRGLLLSPSQVKKAEESYKVVEPYPVEFISFSEDIECAVWFARPDSWMSQFVYSMDPSCMGFVIEHDIKPSEVLFYYEWHDLLNIESMLPWVSKNLAANGINNDLRQYLWNVKSQSEIILKPIGDEFDLIPERAFQVKSTKELDKQFKPPFA